MKYLIVIIAMLLTGCGSAPKSRNNKTWISEWNVGEMEYAAELMELSDYVRYSQQVTQQMLDKTRGSYPPTDIEKEFVYYSIALKYMNLRQRCVISTRNHLPTQTTDCSDTIENKSKIYARKLMELPNLHLMSKYVIARIQEFDGYDQRQSGNLGIPSGMRAWCFIPWSRGEYKLNDFSDQYQKIISARRGGAIGTIYHSVSSVLLFGAPSTAFDNELGLVDMKQPIGIYVEDWNRHPVQIAGLEKE